MSLATYKTLEFILFFGLVFAFGFWQLASLRRARPDDERSRAAATDRERTDGERVETPAASEEAPTQDRDPRR